MDATLNPWPALLAGLWLSAAGAQPVPAVDLASPPGAEALLGQGRELVASGRPAEAYGLLAPRELDYAGAPAFDYLLGVAALDSGRPAEAAFTLERLLAVAPEFDGARMELARAYFESGDLEAARTQFSYLQRREPPEETRLVIGSYLEAIDARAGVPSRRLLPYVEVGGGYDSNANGSTSDGSFLGFTLDPENVEADSAFYDLAAGLNYDAGLGHGLSTDGFLRGSYRGNPDAHFVDQGVLSAGGNLYWTRGPWRLNGGASGYYGWLDGDEHEAYGGLNAGLGRQLGDGWELRLQASGGALRYQLDELEVQDVDRYLGSLAVNRYGLGGSRAGRVSLVLLAGTDDERRADSPYGNDRLGIRATASWLLAPGSLMYVEAGALRSDYDDAPGFFGADREDKQYTALVATEYNDWPAAGWTLVPRLRYVQNDSSVSLYEYDRWEAGVTLRRWFR